MRKKKTKNIFLFFDTNIFFDIYQNCLDFKFGYEYENIKKYISVNKYNQFKIIIPRIVIEELVNQKIENFNNYNTYILGQNEAGKKFYEAAEKLGYDIKVINSNFNTLREYKKYIYAKVNNYLLEEKNNIYIVEYDEKINFTDIVRRSVQKRKPFFKGGQNNKPFSDAGFKDVLFLESIKKLEKSSNTDFIVFTDDGFLLETNIIKEFNNRIGEFKDLKTAQRIIEYLNEKYDLIDNSDYINFINDDYFDQYIIDALNCKILDKYYDLIEEKDEEDNVLLNIRVKVEKNDIVFNILVTIDTNKNFISIKKELNNEIIYFW